MPCSQIAQQGISDILSEKVDIPTILFNIFLKHGHKFYGAQNLNYFVKKPFYLDYC